MRAYLVQNPGAPPRFGTVAADAKREARERAGTVTEHEIPETKRELVPWLNEMLEQHWVDGAAEQAIVVDALGLQLASDAFIVGPATKDPPRLSPSFLGDLKSGAEFVPVSKAAEIDRLLQRCPACSRGALAALKTDHVIAWVKFAGIDALQAVADAIKAHVHELGEQLEDRSVQ